jgi:hypothetical protein
MVNIAASWQLDPQMRTPPNSGGVRNNLIMLVNLASKLSSGILENVFSN